MLLFFSTCPSDSGFVITYRGECPASLNLSDFVIKMGTEMPSPEDNTGKTI